MKTNFEEKVNNNVLIKPIFNDLNDIKNFSTNSFEEDSTEDKKIEKKIKPNDYINIFISKNITPNLNKEIFSKINITINKEDILQEQKLLNSKALNLSFFENENSQKKLIFSCKKRLHQEESKTQEPPKISLEKNINNEEIKKKGSKKAKKVVYKKHDKMEKDNIVRKIQVHYCNFLVCFINEVIQKIIIDEMYKTIDDEELNHMKDYLFNNIDYNFKSNIKKKFMEKTENMIIKDIISPTQEFCELHNINNKNKEIMDKIIAKNNPILNKILNQKYLYYFNEIYYQNKRNLVLEEENESINIILSSNTKMLEDLILKNKEDKNYILKLKRVVMQNFTKPKYMFKIKK